MMLQDASTPDLPDIDEPDDNERGAVLAITVASIIVLLGMAAFSVDVGWIFLNKARAQRAADSAALAGVTYLPAELANAQAEALDIADINGYVTGAGVSVTATQVADRRLKVQIEDEAVPLFFMRVFGIQTATVRAEATAEYVTPVPLGSPENVFGADPDDPTHDFATVGFWAAIQHQTEQKEFGDPYATTCFFRQAPYTGCGSANGEFYGLDGAGDPNGYWYAVDVPVGTTDFSVQIYDAGPVNVDGGRPVEPSADNFGGTNEFQVVRHDHTAGAFQLVWGTQTTMNMPFGASEAQMENALETLAGINDVTVTRIETLPLITWEIEFIDPGFEDVAELTPGTNTLTGGANFSTAPGSPSSPLFTGTTVYRLHAPDGSPFNYRDNVVIPACDRSFSAEGDPTDKVWTTLCSFTGAPTPGIYPLRVFTASPGLSQNAYSLKVTGNAPPGEDLRLFALDSFSISSTVDAGSTRFFLAEIEEVHAGKQLVVELFDPGDVAIPGFNEIKLIQPNGDVWNSGCVVEESEDPVGAPVYLNPITITGSCAIDATRPNPATDYNNDWIKITIELPGTYACDTSAGEPDCWWEIEYRYTTQATERTTWRASVPGTLVSLVFDGP